MKDELEKMTLPEVQEKLKEKEVELEAIYKLADKATDAQIDEAEAIKEEITEIKVALATKQKREKFAKERIAASAAGGDGTISLDPETKEISQMAGRLSIAKAFASAAEDKALDGVEQEFTKMASEEMEAAGVERKGQFAIPSALIKMGRGNTNKDLTVATEGADIVEDTIQSGIIPVLNPRPVLSDLGMQYLPNLSGNPQFPRETNTLTFTYEGETDSSAETTPTLDNVKFTPHRLAAHINVSIQTLKQSPQASEAWLRNKISREYELKVDATGIAGPGSGDIPEGILNISGIGAVAMGTNGAALTYAKLVELEEDIETANAAAGNLGILTTPGVKANMRTTPVQASGVEGNFIVTTNNNNEAMGYRLATSTQVPSNLTKGSGTNLHAAIFGNFNMLAMGMWGGFDILYDPYTSAKTGKVVFHVNGYNDFQLFQPTALSAIQDIVKS